MNKGSYKTQPNGKITLRVYVPEMQKYKSFTAASRRECDSRYREWLRSGEIVPKKKSDLTLGEVVDAYINNKTNILSPSTIREYRRIRRMDFGDIMNKGIAELDKNDYQKAVNDMCVDVSVKTAMNRFGLIKSALKEQVEIDISVKFPQRVKPKINIPSSGEVKQIIEAVKDTDLEIPVLLAALCGMRRGEICAVDKINSDNTITVNKVQVITETGSIVIKPYAKTEAGNRTVYLPDIVVKRIKAHKKPIIRYTINSIDQPFHRLVTKMGINIRFHDLRHYYASILMSEGIPDKYVMERIGHSTDNMLKSVYQHTMEERQTKIDNKVNRKMANIFGKI